MFGYLWIFPPTPLERNIKQFEVRDSLIAEKTNGWKPKKIITQ